MTALQASIGALNDVHDAPDDAGHKPGKPIPAGLVSVPAAWAVVVMGAVLGIVLGTLADVRVGMLAVVVLLIGYGYDLVAKGTAWSWLPFALGIPLLPVYGWLGATGDLPSFFIVLGPDDDARRRGPRDRERPSRSGAGRGGGDRLGRDPARHRGVMATPRRPLVAGAHRWAGLRWRSVAWDSPRSSRSSPGLASSGRPLPGHATVDRPSRERAWQFEAAGGGLALLGWLVAAVR